MNPLIDVRVQRLAHAKDCRCRATRRRALPAWPYRGASRRSAADACTGARALVPTGLAIALPDGFEAQVRPRSGLAAKNGVTVLNSPGTVDCDYRGEVKVILINHGAEPFLIERGTRIAQMVVAPVTQARLSEVETLDETARGQGGFGSTGTSGGGR